MKYLFLIPLLILNNGLNAQTLREFDVQEMPEQQIPIFIDFPKEAALIFYTAIPGLTIESNTGGVVAIRSETSKHTVFIRPERQILTLKAPGFIEKKIAMDGLAAKQARFYRVNASEETYTSEKGTYQINTFPEGAMLKIDGFPTFKQLTPFELRDFKAGRYRIYLTKPDYFPIDTLIDIQSGLQQIGIFDLKSKFGNISLRAPVKVVVKVNKESVDVGQEMITKRLPVGDYTIAVNDNRFFPFSETISVQSGTNRVMDLPLKSVFGKLVLRSPVPVTLLIDSDPVQIGTEQQVVELRVGEHNLSVQDSRIEPWESTVQIQSGLSTQLELPLIKKAGFLQIVHPDGFSLTLNGESKVKKPGTEVMELYEGNYRVDVKRTGYQSESFSFAIRKGDVVTWEPDFKAAMVSVSLNTEPEGATILIRRGTETELVGFSPVEEMVPAGEVEFIIKREGYKDYFFPVMLVEGKPFQNTINLTDPNYNNYTTINGIQYGKLMFNGYTYKTVVIGNQEWTVENLRTTTYNDGTKIQDVRENNIWTSNSSGAYCAYGNDEKNVEINGYLYNWYAIKSGRLAPSFGGWRVPNDEDFLILASKTGGEMISGAKLKSETGWNYNGNGSDQYGFSALPSGYRDFNSGNFKGMGTVAVWWCLSSEGGVKAWSRQLVYEKTSLISVNSYRRSGFSVRLVRDVK